VICNSCGFDSPEGFNFCGRCGAPFGEIAPPSPGSEATVQRPDLSRTVQIERATLNLKLPPAEAERRQVGHRVGGALQQCN